MKKLLLTTIIVFFSVCFYGIQGQTTQPQLNQQELWKQTIGTWQAETGKDTLEIWDYRLYGEAFIINVDMVIKGKKTPLYMNNMGFNSNQGKFYGFALYPSGSTITWIGSYVSDKKFKGELSAYYNPESVWGKFEFNFDSPTTFNLHFFNMEGNLTNELKFKKIK